MIDLEYQKTCPECQRDFTASRVDQIFCSRNCLNKNKNRIARTKRKKVCPIDKVLHKNREILEELYAKNEDHTVSKEKLLTKDYNFRFHTHTNRNPTGVSFYFVYEYGFALTENNLYKIVLHECSI